MFENLIYKRVYDEEGHNFYLEIWQGDQHIKLRTESSSFGTNDHAGKAQWDKLKHYVDNLLKKDDVYAQSRLDTDSQS